MFDVEEMNLDSSTAQQILLEVIIVIVGLVKLLLEWRVLQLLASAGTSDSKEALPRVDGLKSATTISGGQCAIILGMILMPRSLAGS